MGKLKKLDLPMAVNKTNINNPLLFDNFGELKMTDPQ